MKVALVTGSQSFLGEAICLRLSGDFTIVRTGLRPRDNVENYYQANLVDREQAINLVSKVLEKWGRIDTLICNAGGVFGVSGSPHPNDALDVSVDNIRALFDRNVLTAINCCHAVVPHMQQRRSGNVVLVGSHLVGNPGGGKLMAYVISKAALHEYAAQLSSQVFAYGVCVNCVSPHGVSLNDPKQPTPQDFVGTVDYLASCVGLHGQVIRVKR